jgi:hypothetical protein
MWEYILDSAGSIYSELSGCCEHENEVHCLIKIGEYLEEEMNCHLLKYIFHGLFKESECL